MPLLLSLLVLLGVCTVALAAPPVTITPATDLQAAITANPPGATFLLTAGTHRRGPLTPKNDQTFLGAPGAVLSGGEILTGWTASGSDFFVAGQTQQGQVDHAAHCMTGFAQCANPEDVFYDGTPLLGVASQAALGPGKFFFDYAADRIYIRDTPTGHTVETSVRAAAFVGTAQNVTLKNLTIEKYATPTQKGAIEVSTASHEWVIEQCIFRHNHSRGIHITGHGWLLRGNTITMNGHMGAGGGEMKNTLIEGNLVTDNNYARINPGFEGGGVKLAVAIAARFIRNDVRDNYGTGLWCDINCRDVLYADNIVVHNAMQGIFHEISYRAVVRGNTSLDNGWSGPNWAYHSQIGGGNTQRMEIYGNVVRVPSASGAGLALLQQDRGVGLWGRYVLRLNRVHHNTIRFVPGTSFDTGYTGITADVLDIGEGGNLWDYNLSFVDAAASVWIWPYCPQLGNYATFQACGLDLHGARYAP